jgi:hypothetical protein
MPTTVFFRNLFRESASSPDHHRFPHGVAYFSANRWWYSGVNFGGSAMPAPIAQADVASLKSWILTTFGDHEPLDSDYRPGTAYKRISLPLNTPGSLHNIVDSSAMTQSFVALKLLLSKMQDVFETVEAAELNLQTYGHKIRELLLLAAMEVEASWTAVLRTNGYIEQRPTTKDYVKLLAPMLLDSFGLTLVSYPGFPQFSPFRGWTVEAPTRSLDWYDAYNRTKHNREEFLGAATLERAVHAVGAATVMFYAQFGYSFQPGDDRRNFLRSVFGLSCDQSRYPTSCYIPNAVNGPGSWEWELLNYPFAS